MTLGAEPVSGEAITGKILIRYVCARNLNRLKAARANVIVFWFSYAKLNDRIQTIKNNPQWKS